MKKTDCPLLIEAFHMMYLEPEIISRSRSKTGTWRNMRPVIMKAEACTLCGTCWFFCPECALFEKDGHFEVDLEYCKGCGICAVECPLAVITMEEEAKWQY